MSESAESWVELDAVRMHGRHLHFGTPAEASAFEATEVRNTKQRLGRMRKKVHSETTLISWLQVTIFAFSRFSSVVRPVCGHFGRSRETAVVKTVIAEGRSLKGLHRRGSKSPSRREVGHSQSSGLCKLGRYLRPRQIMTFVHDPK